MTWTHVQHSTEASGTATSITPAFSSGSTAGNLLTCKLLVASGSDTITLPPGWVQRAVMTSNGANHVELWDYLNNPGGITSVVVTSSASANMKATLSEFSSNVAGVVVVANATGTAKAGTVSSLAVATGTAAAAGDLTECVFCEHFVTASAITWTDPAGFTQTAGDTASAGNHLYSAYDLSVSSGTLTVTGTSNTAADGANGWSGAVVTYSETTTSAGTPYHIGSSAPVTSTSQNAVTPVTATGHGDAIVVCTATTGTTAKVTSISDTASNTYSLVQRYAAGSFSVEMWLCAGSNALLQTGTITVFWSGAGTTHRVDVMGCPGVSAVAVADPGGSAEANGTSASPSTGATGSLQATGELAIAVAAYGSGGGTITWGNSYNSMASVQAGSTEFLATAWKSLATTSGTTASGTITSAPWTIMVATLTVPSGGAPFVWYDGTYSGWQAMQAAGITDPPMMSFGPAWTAAQKATLPPDTIRMPLDNTGGSPASTTVIDVENGDVTTPGPIASWINARNALPGGYAANRPTVYLNTSGLYYVNAANDVITPLASTYNLKLGRDYDLWAANRTGSQPSAPVVTLGVPCVATQYMSYAQTGAQYDVNIAFDTSWVAAFGGTSVTKFIASEVDVAVDLTESLTGATPVIPGPGGGSGQPSNGWPQLFLEIALPGAQPVAKLGTFILNDPVYGQLNSGHLGDADNWTDITSYIINADSQRPSTREQGPLISYQAGTLSVTLDNSDGRFDPDNPASPYVVNGQGLRAMIPVRLRATYGPNGTGYGLWQGYADGWEPSDVTYEGGYAELTLNATDGFKVLGGITLAAAPTPVGDGEDTGARIRRILTAAGWYSGHRNIATGDTTLQGTVFGDTALNLIQIAVDSEIGEFWQDGSGYAVFRNRQAILADTRSNTPQATFGDLPGAVHGSATELAYAVVGRASDDTTLANDVQITRVGGTLQEVKNNASITTYLFPRTYARSDIIVTDDETALLYAQWVLYVSKSGEDRFETLTIDPLADTTDLFPQVLGREIGDRITIWHRPANVAAFSRDCFIRGIEHQIDAVNFTWSTIWTLQDATRYGSFMTLDSAVNGQLNHNALAY